MWEGVESWDKLGREGVLVRSLDLGLERLGPQRGCDLTVALNVRSLLGIAGNTPWPWSGLSPIGTRLCSTTCSSSLSVEQLPLA